MMDVFEKRKDTKRMRFHEKDHKPKGGTVNMYLFLKPQNRTSLQSIRKVPETRDWVSPCR